MNAIESTSTRPYLIRALYDWCTDNGLTPYVAVAVDDSVQVPRDYVKNGEIVLNISFDATSSLKLGNDFIEFKARFAGVARDIMVPVGRVLAIYARENGQGMAFPVDTKAEGLPSGEAGAVGAAGEASGAGVADGAGVGRGRSPALTSVPAAEGDRPQLVSLDSPASPPESAGDEEPPPPRPAGGGPRPALKRVK
jgi:stringent starvation protein B